jgi:mRNA (guanine-N7-)-methyltransferase
MSRKREERDSVGDDSKVVRDQGVLDHYSKRPNATQAQRQSSPIFGIKCMNNWIKAVLMKRFVMTEQRGRERGGGAVVLDLCGGKGGDLFKWEKAGASCVFLIDGAEGSVYDAQQRYQQSDLYKEKKNRFTVLFGVGDCFVVRLHDVLLPKDLTFDIVSCQFAAHYAWASESKAKRFLENCADRLCPGGFLVGTIPNKDELVARLQSASTAGSSSFGNRLYSVTFPTDFDMGSEFGCSYSFSLEDAVTNCEEYLVSKESFVKLATNLGLELVEWLTFEEFRKAYSNKPSFSQLFEDMVTKKTEVSRDEWEIVNLYSSFVFRKRSDNLGGIKRADPSKLGIDSTKVVHFF